MMTAQATATAPVTTAAQVLDAVQPTAQNPVASAPNTGAAEPAAAKPDESASSKLQVLIKREKIAVERERTAKTREEQLAAKEATLAAREAKLQEFENIKHTNPRKALELMGMTYQDLTQAELNDGEVPPEVQIKQVSEKFDTYLKSQEDAKRQAEEQRKQDEDKERTKTIENHKTEITGYIKENAARYELITFENSEDLVYDVIEEHFQRTYSEKVKSAQEKDEDTSEIVGEIMTIAQAADKVEAYLEKKYDKAKSLSKVQALLARKAVENLPKQQNQARQTPKTLTNNLSASQSPAKAGPRTDADRIAAAIAYARGLRTSP